MRGRGESERNGHERALADRGQRAGVEIEEQRAVVVAHLAANAAGGDQVQAVVGRALNRMHLHAELLGGLRLVVVYRGDGEGEFGGLVVGSDRHPAEPAAAGRGRTRQRD